MIFERVGDLMFGTVGDMQDLGKRQVQAFRKQGMSVILSKDGDIRVFPAPGHDPIRIMDHFRNQVSDTAQLHH